MRLPHTNSTISIKRKAVTTGDKKAATVIASGIPAYIEDIGAADEQQTLYIIMYSREDSSVELNQDKDIINDGTYDYNVANPENKRYHIECRAIRAL